jgi:hypothetical protein
MRLRDMQRRLCYLKALAFEVFLNPNFPLGLGCFLKK